MVLCVVATTTAVFLLYSALYLLVPGRRSTYFVLIASGYSVRRTLGNFFLRDKATFLGINRRLARILKSSVHCVCVFCEICKLNEIPDIYLYINLVKFLNCYSGCDHQIQTRPPKLLDFIEIHRTALFYHIFTIE